MPLAFHPQRTEKILLRQMAVTLVTQGISNAGRKLRCGRG